MDGKSEERIRAERDKLDILTARIRYGSEVEAVWEKRGNVLVENHPYLIGYIFIVGLAVLVFSSHLTAFFMSFLFLYFISDFMANDVRRYIPFVPKMLLFSILYILLVALIFLLTYKIVPGMAKQFPDMANQLQTQITRQLKDANQHYNLTRYVDLEDLRAGVVQASTGFLKFLMNGLSPLYKGIIQFIFALVINSFLYLDMEKIDEVFRRRPRSMMGFLYDFIGVRLRIFYFYFKRVMGGQVIIATINTVISSVVIVALGLPHPFLLIFIVFFCGLFPVVGNLVSNTVLCISAFVSLGLWGTGVCLILLITVHKLEYFLNSRIIGGIVRLPMTISLAALIFCEVLFGIPGLILAIPLTLFLRHELEHIPGFSGGGPKEPGTLLEEGNRT